MKKHSEKLPRLNVEYKGGELILPPGHKVFEMDIRTGIVQEHKLVLKVVKQSMLKKIERKLFKARIGEIDTRPKYMVDEKDGFLYLPAFTLGKAKTKFKKLSRELGITVKIAS